jgi:hypothetical protein
MILAHRGFPPNRCPGDARRCPPRRYSPPRSDRESGGRPNRSVARLDADQRSFKIFVSHPKRTFPTASVKRVTLNVRPPPAKAELACSLRDRQLMGGLTCGPYHGEVADEHQPYGD